MDVRPVRSQSVTLNSSVGERSRTVADGRGRSRTDGNETTTETKQRPFPNQGWPPVGGQPAVAAVQDYAWWWADWRMRYYSVDTQPSAVLLNALWPNKHVFPSNSLIICTRLLPSMRWMRPNCSAEAIAPDVNREVVTRIPFPALVSCMAPIGSLICAGPIGWPWEYCLACTTVMLRPNARLTYMTPSTPPSLLCLVVKLSTSRTLGSASSSCRTRCSNSVGDIAIRSGRLSSDVTASRPSTNAIRDFSNSTRGRTSSSSNGCGDTSAPRWRKHSSG